MFPGGIDNQRQAVWVNRLTLGPQRRCSKKAADLWVSFRCLNLLVYNDTKHSICALPLSTCSKLTIETPKQCVRSGVSIIGYEQVNVCLAVSEKCSPFV